MLTSWLLNAYLDLVYGVLITLGQVKLTSIITGRRTYNLSVDICNRFGIDKQYLWKKRLSLGGSHLHMHCSRNWCFLEK